MIREIIDVIPFWWFIILVMLCFILISYVTAHLSVYFFSEPVNKEHRDQANQVIVIMSGGFSILLAFVIINTWTYLQMAETAASREADSLALIVRNARPLPEEAKIKITEAAGNYAVTVRVDEWQMMRKGKESPMAWLAIEDLYKAIQDYHPQTDQEKLYYKQIIIAVGELLKARRERLNELKSIIPKPLREALIVGSILLAGILGAMRGEANFFNMMPVLLFSLILGFNLGLALNLDYPFSGDIVVKNDLFYSGALSQFVD